ncbi:CpeR family transcriptional regulator [Microcoleus sp. A2-C2]|uniref:CpeR family transcriptional regulator n=1 Tax=unclassified Microcoleus TaxID=2642155 RepID=UPI002FD2084D
MSTISINWLDKIKSEILITFFLSTMSITLNRIRMLPPQAEKKLQCWIRSRHLICSGNFYIFETIDYSAIERFTESITALGGTLISVQPIDKIWMGDHRQVILYRAKASLHTPCHNLKQYWFKYGSFQTRFDPSS